MSTQIYGVSSGDSRADLSGNLSVSAPVTHGFTQFELTITDGVVQNAKPLPGSMHRGVEKLFESRDYRQILTLANRHEWLGAYAGEVGVAQMLESALGIEVPDSAVWLRNLLMEYTRVTSHLAFLAGFPSSDFAQLSTQRELWIKHIADYTGNRMHPMVTRIGGFAHAPTSEWVNGISQLSSKLSGVLKALPKFDQFTGVGVLTESDAIQQTVSGPVARASGYAIDLRASSLKYYELDFEIVTQSAGDIPARVNQLIAELNQSLDLINQLAPICASKVNDELNVLLPKVIRVPQGTYSYEIETPLGIASWLLVSQNDKMPYRLKLRPASLHTLLATESVLKGVAAENIDVTIASMPFISGDVDR